MRPSAAYVRLQGNMFESTALTTGPWSPFFSHGGPPCGLAAQCMSDRGRELGFGHLARLTANILRPVPVTAELEVRVRNVYVGKSCAHLSAQVLHGDRELLLCTALAVKELPVDLPASLPSLPLAPPLQQATPVATLFKFAPVAYDDLVELRQAEGRIWKGPCAVWFRMRHSLIEGESAIAPMARVAVAADSGGGISSVLSSKEFSFVNADLTISLLRPLRGEWVCLRSETFLGPVTSGLVETQLFDEDGLVGCASQNLIVSKLSKL